MMTSSDTQDAVTQVEHLHESLGGCTSLVELYANFCSLDSMDVHLANCKKLEKFEFDGNFTLTYPPREVSLKGASAVLRYFRQILDCPKSKMMILDSFDLSDVDRIILGYPEMTWLDMSNNNIGQLPADVRQLQAVEVVNFSSNKLGSIPKILSLMDTIRDLSLDRNGIEQIEPSVLLLSNLTRLSLAENEIARIHPALFKLTSLSFLNLNDNRISRVPGMIDELDGLVSLGLGSNAIEEVPHNIRYLTNLKQLVLFGNKLTKLPEAMQHLQQLEILTVSQNSIRGFPPVLATALTNLKELWLTHNLLETLPPEIEELRSLRELWLQDNKLQSLPVELGNLTNLKVLTLTGNRLREIPRHIKDLKIVRHTDRDAGEEYWQDNEKDGFRMGEFVDSEMLTKAETMPWSRTAEDEHDERVLSITHVRKERRVKAKDANGHGEGERATGPVVPKLSITT
jgi:Leucine-rich repeat (LRR) protein